MDEQINNYIYYVEPNKNTNILIKGVRTLF